ncbi:hypothetical protein HBI38_184030 [Parastagonospora nodorum]|nr:hypothetical protein HBI52_166880 [Parastagonospora nodorum]KAH6258388.1 hypothetical protein HBI41_152510 [Parastagonospora nodorum]KAH6284973.1 hypothetical protein HBI40_127280 [Parastagonospora nodorum]KAH6309012.1 hypothetical protein HBI38_184030 [Parastagonospora nodorum]
MRILCLHGAGSSGAIFEVQIANLQHQLDPSIELVFTDGPFECERGPGAHLIQTLPCVIDILPTGVPEYHPGPFFTFTQNYAPFHMARAVEYVEDLIAEEGPFEGIVGFSQGAALTLSYLYHQQKIGNAPGVRFACLFSTTVPMSSDCTMGDEIISNLRALEYNIADRSICSSEDLTMGEREFVTVLQQTVVDATFENSHFPQFDMDILRCGERDAVPCVMLPSFLAQKIQIPTVHVWGRNDSQTMIKMAEVARSLCDDSRVKTVLHTGLHDVPKRGPEIKAVLRTIDWVMAQA